MSDMSRIKTFNLPDLGEGLTEGEILTWLVKVGDTIELNQPIVEVETAKAAVEIPAKWAGQVQAIHHPEGTTVEVGAPIIAIDTDPGAGPLDATSTTAAPSGDLPTPSAASLAAVEVAPAEGMVEPGLIAVPPRAAARRCWSATAPAPRPRSAAPARAASRHRPPPHRLPRWSIMVLWWATKPLQPPQLRHHKSMIDPRRRRAPGWCLPSRRCASSPRISGLT